MRLLLVEDDDILAQTLSQALTDQNYVVDVAYDGEEGWDYAQSFTYDLILLDVSLPKLNGIALCQRLRQEDCHTPILMLTARDSSSDKVTGLDAGADDYVVKPCTISELFARIRALLRRQSASGAPILAWEELTLDPSSCDVNYKGQPVDLSPKEYALLELFLRNPKRVFNKSTILEHLWSFEDPPSDDTIRAHIKGLRRKLKAVEADQLIETIYGVGYRLRALPDKKPPESPVPSKAEKTRQAVQQAWEQFKPAILKRLMVIEQAIAAWGKNTLSPDLQEDAAQQAHKLVGSLGMYGFPEASLLSRQLEHQLLDLTTTSPPILTQLLQTLRQHIDPPSTFPLVLIIDPNSAWVEQLTSTAPQWSVRVASVAHLKQAKTFLKQETPDLILLDPQGEWASLKYFTTRYPKIPVLVMTVGDRFAERLTVARLGGKGFLVKPLTPAQVFQFIQHTLQDHQCPPTHLLIIDDDLTFLQDAKTTLTPEGFTIHTCSDPRQSWQLLTQIKPDLLILALEMPHISGLELCQVIRNDPTWKVLPILLLTPALKDQPNPPMPDRGADDYLSKPVNLSQLKTRIYNRLERTRQLQNATSTPASS
ncbi:response regulator [Spirulina subsalsa]|uniref:response regulator n=1 Tax=Spirulina subsalsa TaxID=54311 RepID=UPI0002FE875F|nr:response regulator [Spirulina subsalsa]